MKKPILSISPDECGLEHGCHVDKVSQSVLGGLASRKSNTVFPLWGSGGYRPVADANRPISFLPSYPFGWLYTPFSLALEDTMKIITVPPRPKDLKILNRRWPLAAYALHFLATQSNSARIEHEKQLAEYFEKPAESKLIRNTYRKDLLREGLIHSKTTKYLRGVYAITIIRLSEKGRELCQSFGWEVCENEWQRLITRHSGDDQPRHTASMIVFSLSARMRGWKVTTLPETNTPYFYPDLLLEKDDQKMYVEVELGSRKKEKWNLYKKMQGYAAICGKTFVSSGTLIRECKEVGLGGIATDLEYLAELRNYPEKPLWRENWDGKGE